MKKQFIITLITIIGISTSCALAADRDTATNAGGSADGVTVEFINPITNLARNLKIHIISLEDEEDMTQPKRPLTAEETTTIDRVIEAGNRGLTIDDLGWIFTIAQDFQINYQDIVEGEDKEKLRKFILYIHNYMAKTPVINNEISTRNEIFRVLLHFFERTKAYDTNFDNMCDLLKCEDQKLCVEFIYLNFMINYLFLTSSAAELKIHAIGGGPIVISPNDSMACMLKIYEFYANIHQDKPDVQTYLIAMMHYNIYMYSLTKAGEPLRKQYQKLFIPNPLEYKGVDSVGYEFYALLNLLFSDEILSNLNEQAFKAYTTGIKCLAHAHCSILTAKALRTLVPKAPLGIYIHTTHQSGAQSLECIADTFKETQNRYLLLALLEKFYYVQSLMDVFPSKATGILPCKNRKDHYAKLFELYEQNGIPAQNLIEMLNCRLKHEISWVGNYEQAREILDICIALNKRLPEGEKQPDQYYNQIKAEIAALSGNFELMDEIQQPPAAPPKKKKKGGISAETAAAIRAQQAEQKKREEEKRAAKASEVKKKPSKPVGDSRSIGDLLAAAEGEAPRRNPAQIAAATTAEEEAVAAATATESSDSDELPQRRISIRATAATRDFLLQMLDPEFSWAISRDDLKSNLDKLGFTFRQAKGSHEFTYLEGSIEHNSEIIAYVPKSNNGFSGDTKTSKHKFFTQTIPLYEDRVPFYIRAWLKNLIQSIDFIVDEGAAAGKPKGAGGKKKRR